MTDKALAKIRALIIAFSALLGIIVLQQCLSYVYDGICFLITGKSFQENELWVVGFYVFYSIISILIFSVCYKIIRTEDWPDCFKSSASRLIGLILVGIALQAAAYGALNIIYQIASDNEVLNSYNSMIKNLNGSVTPFIFLYTMFFAPIVEELVFRGVIFEGCKQGFGVFWGNIIQALCFGVFHGNIVQFIYAFVLGIMLGYIMSQRHNIFETIFVHIIINCAGIFVVPIIASYLAYAVGPMIAFIIIFALACTGCTVWFLVQRKIKTVHEQIACENLSGDNDEEKQ